MSIENPRRSLLAGMAGLLCWASVTLAGQPGPAPEAARADYWVAPDGKDTNPGTKAAPFATLSRARDAVRQKVAAGLTKDLLVVLRGGTYSQTETLTFGPEDSGNEKYSITYAACPGEKVVLSGGRRIAGWKKGEGNVWTVELPEVKAGSWYFRQLFVAGQRAIRARTPNVDDEKPWWHIRTSSIQGEQVPPEDVPITVTVTGPIQAYRQPEAVELIYIANNNGSRKPLGAVNAEEQTITLNPPHRWNPSAFGSEWRLSVPVAGWACYLENAREMLDQPGEWYLDRQTGVLSYWPREGEDLTRDEVVAPVLHNTLLAVRGTAAQAVRNLHFRGLHVEHVEWPMPATGYLGMFCCNIPVGDGPKPGHRFTDAAVEFEQARACDFVEGRIAHVGAMGLCLRGGTTDNVIEGNEICDAGGGGIGLGYPNVAFGYLDAAAPPGSHEYTGYRVANNYIHHCGLTDYGAGGLVIFSTRDGVFSHNLIHDIAYFGIGFAGSQDPQVPFAGNNRVEFNHVYRAMQVTQDGAALYATFAQYDQGGLIRGNLLHDQVANVFDNPSGMPQGAAGIYLDGFCKGCRFEANVAYRTSQSLFIGLDLVRGVKDNLWLDNAFIGPNAPAPPQEFTDAMAGYAGLEPAYRHLQKDAAPIADYYPLTESVSTNGVWSGYQFHRPKSDDGAVAVCRRNLAKDGSVRLPLRGLNATASYELKLSADSFNGLLIYPSQLRAELLLPEGQTRMTGQQLMSEGLPIQAQPEQILWITYRRVP